MTGRDWSPFVLCSPGERAPKPRGLHLVEGIGDRLRTAAFAELQAREGFLWAADFFIDAPREHRDEWKVLAAQEHRHQELLLGRLEALAQSPSAVPVSDRLWSALLSCRSGRDFGILIGKAEERGRVAAVNLAATLAHSDPESARIFNEIAAEEESHVELARRFYPI